MNGLSGADGGISEKLRELPRDGVCFAAGIVIAVLFSIFIPSFSEFDNLASIFQNIAFLGILGLAQCVVVLNGQIDLSQTMIMLISSCCSMLWLSQGHPPALAIFGGFAVANGLGFLNALAIVTIKRSAFVITFATGLIFYGSAKTLLLQGESVFELDEKMTALQFLAKGSVGSVPFPVILFFCTAVVGWIFLNFFNWGRMIRFMGSNPAASFCVGMPTKAVTFTAFMLSASGSFVAGLLLFSTVRIISYDQFATSTSLYDIILLVILGGVSLSGGKGGIRGVLASGFLVAILLNGLTLSNLSNDLQQVFKAICLLLVILLDTRINRKNEEELDMGDVL